MSLMTGEATVDRSRLAPDDAFLVRSPPSSFASGASLANGSGLRPLTTRRARDQRKNRSRSRRRKDTSFKKLLWVKSPYPDNHTDEETFLDHLQRNPRLQPYEFWPLVSDSAVIVQQVCTMIVFVCCFSGIIQERVSPVTVVTWGTICTVVGWILWDAWVGQEEALKATVTVAPPDHNPADTDRDTIKDPPVGLGLSMAASSRTSPRKGAPALSTAPHSRSTSGAFTRPSSAVDPPMSPRIVDEPSNQSQSYYRPYGEPASRLTPRNQQRLATAKSAWLIFCALLGLSPILKSLTKSTASDSIWAISFWLMCINVFFFDYGGGVGANFPASLSTNAALMASTVLASRLPSTTHVFSLTLFSIEVFGLFPVFRRYLRHISWLGHILLTWLLVVGAGFGVAMSISGGGWTPAILGVVLGCVLTGLAMGLCSWWLIGLQRYKNEIHGPWDPARPIIKRQWD